MPHPDIARSQAATLREWSDIWERDARAGVGEGASEVAFLMARVASQIDRALGGVTAAPSPVMGPDDEDAGLPEAEEMEGLRDG